MVTLRDAYFGTEYVWEERERERDLLVRPVHPYKRICQNSYLQDSVQIGHAVYDWLGHISIPLVKMSPIRTSLPLLRTSFPSEENDRHEPGVRLCDYISSGLRALPGAYPTTERTCLGR